MTICVQYRKALLSTSMNKGGKTQKRNAVYKACDISFALTNERKLKRVNRQC
jgi:hypothetical protein